MRTGSGQNYLDHWGFSRAPFALTPDPDMLYLSKQHRECMLRLQYAIAGNKGGALLVSENPGDGKTSVLRRLERDLLASTEENYRVVFIDHPTLTPNQILWEIMRQLGLGKSKGAKIQTLLQLKEALLDMHERGERCVFILDEGQMLADRPELLQEFRILLNYTVGETFLLTFIFCGQSELETTVKNLPEFYQRLPVRYFLHSMDLADTGRMLEYRIKVAGYSGPVLFTERAVKEIYRYSRGIPRVICSVADLALVVGHSRGVRRITDSEVLMAIIDFDRNTQDGYHYYHFLHSAGATSQDEADETDEAEKITEQRLRVTAEADTTRIFVHCPSCGIRQLNDRRSCTQCSAPLHWLCPSCQHKNLAQHLRCDRCGQSLALALAESERALREAVSSSVTGASWGIVPAPDFSLKLGEGEKIMAVMKNRQVFGKGLKVRARLRAWGNKDRKVDLVITNHRIHIIARELQSRIPYHEIQGLKATSSKIHLFHDEGSVYVDYPTGDSEIYSLIHAIMDFLAFQSERFRI